MELEKGKAIMVFGVNCYTEARKIAAKHDTYATFLMDDIKPMRDSKYRFALGKITKLQPQPDVVIIMGVNHDNLHTAIHLAKESGMSMVPHIIFTPSLKYNVIDLGDVLERDCFKVYAHAADSELYSPMKPSDTERVRNCPSAVFERIEICENCLIVFNEDEGVCPVCGTPIPVDPLTKLKEQMKEAVTHWDYSPELYGVAQGMIRAYRLMSGDESFKQLLPPTTWVQDQEEIDAQLTDMEIIHQCDVHGLVAPNTECVHSSPAGCRHCGVCKHQIEE